MSGVIYKDSSISEKSKLGIPGESPESIYLPLVPGVVESVITGVDDTLFFGRADVNSIYARKHIGDPSIKKKYIPLLRGFVDTLNLHMM